MAVYDPRQLASWHPRPRSWPAGDGLADRLVSLRDTSQRGTPMKLRSFQRTGWTRIFPPLTWLADYKPSWLRHDAIAGVTLAAYAIPVSLAYAGLAGLPPQIGIYASTACWTRARPGNEPVSVRNGRLDREQYQV